MRAIRLSRQASAVVLQLVDPLSGGVRVSGDRVPLGSEIGATHRLYGRSRGVPVELPTSLELRLSGDGDAGGAGDDTRAMDDLG